MHPLRVVLSFPKLRVCSQGMKPTGQPIGGKFISIYHNMATWYKRITSGTHSMMRPEGTRKFGGEARCSRTITDLRGCLGHRDAVLKEVDQSQAHLYNVWACCPTSVVTVTSRDVDEDGVNCV